VVRKNKTPVHSIDDDSFIGFIIDDGTTFQAVTIFGYLISRTTSRKEAEDLLQEKGPTYLKGVWQYYDKDDHEWFDCVIKRAYEKRVIVNKTNALGYQDPEDYKQVVIENPTENDLIKTT
jgi:hypothetical protein